MTNKRLEEINFNSVKETIDNTISKNPWFKNVFSVFLKYAKIITSYEDETLSYDEYVSNTIDINNSIKIAGDFFGYVSDITKDNSLYSYKQMFYNILNNETKDNGKHTITFEKSKNPKAIIQDVDVYPSGEVNFKYTSTVSDVFMLVHEFTHKFSTTKGYSGSLKRILGENTSILMEFLLEDYLIENNIFEEDDIFKYKKARFYATYQDAITIICEYFIYSLYLKYGDLNETIIKEELNSLDEEDPITNILQENCVNKLDDIEKYNSFQSVYSQRYVNGLLLSCKMHQLIKFDKRYMYNLDSLIRLLGNPIDVTADDFNVSEDELNILEECYSKELDDVITKLSKRKK